MVSENINRLLIAFGNACLEMGKVWRLHTGKDAKIIYEWTPDKEREE